jgi:hypothetical protein
MYLECRHIMPTGIKCKSPALRGKAYCYYHYNLRLHRDDGTRADKEPLKLPSLEDARGIQIALSQVLAAFGSGRIDTRHAGLYLYGLQIAAKLAASIRETKPQEIVRVLECDDEGTPLAPEQTVCEPDVDCDTCERRDECHNLSFNMQSVERIVRSLGGKPDGPDQHGLGKTVPKTLPGAPPDPHRADLWDGHLAEHL